MSIFVEDLISSAKLRSFAPLSQNTFENSDVISIANEEMLLKLVKDIFGQREDFFLTNRDVAIVGSVPRYAIPKRAIGLTLKSLWYKEGDSLQKLLPATEEDISNYAGATGVPERFHIEGDEVVLLPTPASSTGQIRFRYWAKPNLLIATESCARVTNIASAGGTTTFTVNTDLTGSLTTGSKVDFLSATSPFLLWSEDVSVTAISSTEIQVATTDVDNEAGTVEVQIGDYICPAGYANIPMIPYEFHPVLAQMIAVRMLAGLGDLQKWQAAKAELAEVRGEARMLIKNRVETAVKTLVPQPMGLIRSFTRRG